MKKPTRKMLTFKQFVDQKKKLQKNATPTLDTSHADPARSVAPNEIQIGNQRITESIKTTKPKHISQRMGNHSKG